jgi:hypothetical protein
MSDSEAPTSRRIVSIRSIAAVVCAFTSPGAITSLSASSPTCPAMKQSPFATVACEYGAIAGPRLSGFSVLIAA